MKRRCYILVAAAVMLAACEKEIKISLEDQQQKVVVRADNNTTDCPVSLTLSYSQPVFGEHYYPNSGAYFQTIDNAVVTLSVDGGAAMTASQDSGTYTFAHVPQAGERLELRVSVPGRDDVTSTAIVPQRPDVTYVSMEAVNQEYGYATLNVRFTLNDRAADADYYCVRVMVADSTFHTYTIGGVTICDTMTSERYRYFTCKDYMLVNSNDIEDIFDQFGTPDEVNTYRGTAFLFSDGNINGQHHTVELQVINVEQPYIYSGDDGLWETRFSYTLEVTALTKDLYLYRQTMNSQGDELMDIIGEPVQIHGNIEGGIGIFGVSNTFRKLKIEN